MTIRLSGLFKPHKKSLTMLVGALTGSYKLNQHLGKLKISRDTACKSCEKEEFYILEKLTCVQSRLKHLKKYSIEHTKLKHLEVGTILKFLSAIGLLDILQLTDALYLSEGQQFSKTQYTSCPQSCKSIRYARTHLYIRAELPVVKVVQRSLLFRM